jgi:cellobiose phosphorylase
LPTVWPGYQIEWNIGGTQYRFVVENPEHRSRGVASAELDGEAVDAAAIPLLRDGGAHEVRVVLGASVRDEQGTAASGSRVGQGSSTT